MKLKIVKVFFTALFIFIFYKEANAGITSFFVSPASINSGQVTSFTWTASDSSGAKIIFPCIRGIKYFNESGGAISCDTAITGLAPSGAYSASVVNLNTLSQSISVKLVNLKPDGSYDETMPSFASVSVSPIPNIITGFTVSSDAAESPANATFSWTSVHINGVNFKISCVDGLTVTYSGDPRPNLPCETIIFSPNLGANSSAVFKFAHESLIETKVVSVTVIPVMEDGTYDATRGKTLQFAVKPRPPKIPKVVLLKGISGQIVSGSENEISWRGENIAGVNFILPCQGGVSATSSLAATTTLRCGVYAFDENLAGTSTVIISYRNSNSYNAQATLQIVPFLDNGTYDSVNSVKTTFEIAREAPVSSVSSPSSAPPPLILPEATAVPPPSTAAPVKPFWTFSKNLYLGLVNDPDVLALQKILIYEGVYSGPVTGNFYSMTRAGVMEFQKKHGISQVGLVGPQTRAKLNELYASDGPVPLPSSTPTPTPTPIPLQTSMEKPVYSFSKNLYLGLVNDPDVLALQKILIYEGVYSGPVTGNFYSMTRAGVMEFQKKHGISQVGLVGPQTRAKLNELYGGTSSVSPTPSLAPSSVLPPVSSPTISPADLKYEFRNPLYYGMTDHPDVRALQKILIYEKLYSGAVTGNFDAPTHEAVKEFQEKYGILPFGSVGPATRDKLNELYFK